MFGSAKYRSYEYGADDHISVIHTDKIPNGAAKFITSVIHKTSYTGEFHYGRNFYPKDADALIIQLPVKNKRPDFDFMHSCIVELETEYAKELEAYLLRTGLNNYELTQCREKGN